MNWTTITDTSYTGMNSWYNSTTLLKTRYDTASISQWNWDDSITSTSASHTIGFHSGSYGQAQYGIKDSIIANATFTSVGASGLNPIDFLELNTHGAEIYAFRDNTNNAHFLCIGMYETESDDVIHIDYGVDIEDGAHQAAYSKTNNQTIDILNFTTEAQSINNNFGTDYVVQPLYIFDEASPFYTISGNTVLAPFTVIQVQLKKFLVIGKGICVEID